MRLFDADYYDPDEMLWHPAYQGLQPMLAALISQLRACRTVEDGVAFQNDLLQRLLNAERLRRECARAADRVRKRRAPQPSAPEPQSGRPAGEEDTWKFERDVYARLARQLRAVGDALAWRAFGFHRPFILALMRNDPPGPMFGKAGLQTEMDEVTSAWKRGEFALLHDLTNCLRIGDVTIFHELTSPETREIKKNPDKVKGPQLRRVNEARAAVLNGGPLPGENPGEKLYDLDLPMRTHLDTLAATAVKATTDGVAAALVPGHRALAVVDQYGLAAKGVDLAAFGALYDEVVSPVRRRAGIVSLDHAVHSSSLDASAMDPQRVPWANYPLDPVICARLIADYAIALVETSGPHLARLLEVATGLEARWTRKPGRADLQPGEVIMSVHRQAAYAQQLSNGWTATPGWTLEMRRSALDRYLIELIRPGLWAQGIEYMLTHPQGGQPWPRYRAEEEIWV
jgi:hypothetical protein